MSIWLCERLSFDKLFRVSDPRRVYRSFTVRGPPLEIDSYQDTVYYCFNFKASPSTTGLRHRGYIKFFKPEHKSARSVPLQHLECLVDCECPDFRYRWAWANKQRGSSRVGNNSLNQAWNRAPRKTNPSGRPGLCKHILAARQFIYGLISAFPGNEPDTAEKLNKLTAHATTRWTDYAGAQAHAKEVEQRLLQARAQKNIGMAKPILPKPVTPEQPPEELEVPEPEPEEIEAPEIEPLPKEEPELAVPPGERGRGFPSPPKKPEKRKRVIGGRTVSTELPVKGMLPSQHHIGAWESVENLFLGCVVNAANGHTNMNTLNDAIKLVEEMEADELALQQGGMGGGDEFGGGGAGGLDDMGSLDQPMEPPMSDGAIGADTEGETALGLLRQMKDLLTQIVIAVAPEAMPGEEGAPGEEGMDGMGGGAGDPMDGIEMPGEPPDEMGGGEGAPESGEPAAEEGGEEGGEEEGETRPVPKPKKKEKESGE